MSSQERGDPSGFVVLTDMQAGQSAEQQMAVGLSAARPWAELAAPLVSQFSALLSMAALATARGLPPPYALTVHSDRIWLYLPESPAVPAAVRTWARAFAVQEYVIGRHHYVDVVVRGVRFTVAGGQPDPGRGDCGS